MKNTSLLDLQGGNVQKTSSPTKKRRREPFIRFDALTSTKISEAVRLSRRDQDLTLDQLADATGISKRTLIKLEQGQDVRFSTLTTVLSWLGLALDFSKNTKEKLAKAQRDDDKNGVIAEERNNDGEWY